MATTSDRDYDAPQPLTTPGLQAAIADVIALAKEARRIVAFTGAGVSDFLAGRCLRGLLLGGDGRHCFLHLAADNNNTGRGHRSVQPEFSIGEIGRRLEAHPTLKPVETGEVAWCSAFAGS